MNRSASLRLCLLLLVGAASVRPQEPRPPEGPPAPPAKEATAGRDLLPEVTWWAAQQSLDEEHGVIILWHGWIRAKRAKIEADRLVYFRNSQELYAEGNVRVRERGLTLRAETAFLSLAEERGFLIDALLQAAGRAQGSAFVGTSVLGVQHQAVRSGYLEAFRGPLQVDPMRDPYAPYLKVEQDPQNRQNLVLRAEVICRRNRLHFLARKAYLTIDDRAEPSVRLDAERMDYYLRETPPAKEGKAPGLETKEVLLQDLTLRFGPVPVFQWPEMRYDPEERYPTLWANFGASQLWGAFMMLRVGWDVSQDTPESWEPHRVVLAADERIHRGPGAGATFEYLTPAAIRPSLPETPERGKGYFRFHGLLESATRAEDDRGRAGRNLERRFTPKLDGDQLRDYDANLFFTERRGLDGAGPPSSSLELHQKDLRGFLDFGHHQPLAGTDFLLDVKYQRHTDRDFLLEYFPDEYLRWGEPESLASLRLPLEHSELEVLYRESPQRFDSSPPRSPVAAGAFTGYAPAATWHQLPTPLGAGFYLSGKMQEAHLTRRFDKALIDQPDFSVNRLYGETTVERTLRGAGMSFRMYAGGLAAGYDQSREGGSLAQGAARWGFEFSSRLYSYWPEAQSPELNLDGLRWIMSPRLEYHAFSSPLEPARKFLDFDALDDLRETQYFRFGLDHVFQSGQRQKDGALNPSNFAGLSFHVDAYPLRPDRERLLEGRAFDLLNVDAYFKMTSAVTFGASLGVDPSALGKSYWGRETSSFMVSVDPGGMWRIKLAERYNRRIKDRGVEGFDKGYLQVDLHPNDRWSFSFGESGFTLRPLKPDDELSMNLSVTRHFGALDVSFNYWFNRFLKDHRYSLSVLPAIAYRNLVVREDDYLAGAGEVDEGVIFPEERAFDPAKILQRKKRPPATAPKTPPSEKPSALPPGVDRDDWAPE